MESNALRLHDYPMAALTRNHGANGLGTPLPLDPWLTPPILGSTLSHALPGFLSHPQTAYPSYLTSPVPGVGINVGVSHVPTSIGLVTAAAAAAAAAATSSISPPSPPSHLSSDSSCVKLSLDDGDPRSTSIVSLRMKAKEHLESIHKGFHTA